MGPSWAAIYGAAVLLLYVRRTLPTGQAYRPKSWRAQDVVEHHLSCGSDAEAHEHNSCGHVEGHGGMVRTGERDGQTDQRQGKSG